MINRKKLSTHAAAVFHNRNGLSVNLNDYGIEFFMNNHITTGSAEVCKDLDIMEIHFKSRALIQQTSKVFIGLLTHIT